MPSARGMPLTTVAPSVSSGNPFGVPDALPVTLQHTLLKLSQTSYLQYQANYSTQGFIQAFDSNTNSSLSLLCSCICSYMCISVIELVQAVQGSTSTNSTNHYQFCHKYHLIAAHSLAVPHFLHALLQHRPIITPRAHAQQGVM